MKSTVLTVVLGLGVLFSATYVAAQGVNASLRGTIKDEQGASMPGVTVSARSPVLLTPSVAVTDTRDRTV